MLHTHTHTKSKGWHTKWRGTFFGASHQRPFKVRRKTSETPEMPTATRPHLSHEFSKSQCHKPGREWKMMQSKLTKFLSKPKDTSWIPTQSNALLWKGRVQSAFTVFYLHFLKVYPQRPSYEAKERWGQRAPAATTAASAPELLSNPWMPGRSPLAPLSGGEVLNPNVSSHLPPQKKTLLMG